MDLTKATWKKSSYSGANGGNCVEVASNLRGLIVIRDSKNPHGSALTLTAPTWAALLRRIKSDDLAAGGPR